MNTLAVVVLSGGLDSATALGIALDDHRRAGDVHAISFDYGQKHKIELQCAEDLCEHYNVEHHIVVLNPDPFRGGVLTTEQEVPDMRYDDLPDGEMSPTYVPFRNANLISMAVAYADSTLRDEPNKFRVASEGRWDNALIYAGMHAEDAAGFAYADCTPEFLGAMTAAVHIGTYGRVRLHPLFQFLEKWQIVQMGADRGVPFAMTHSCYRGTRPACGKCSTCHARLDAFIKAGYRDPVEYERTPA